MTGIQVVLIIGVLSIFMYYILNLRNAFIELLAILLFAALSIFFILFPEYTNSIAQQLGVGRGADLLFYICILLFLFLIMKLFARTRRLERMITEMVRNQAKASVIYPETKNDYTI